MLQPVILLWNVCSVSECLFLFWFVWFHPLPIYPIVFRHTRLPVSGKLSSIAAMEVSKQTGSEIADSTWPKKPWHLFKKLYEQRLIKTWISQLINLQCKAPFTPRTITIKITIKIMILADANRQFILSTNVSAALNSRACDSRIDSDWVSMILSFISWKKSFWWFQRYRLM